MKKYVYTTILAVMVVLMAFPFASFAVIDGNQALGGSFDETDEGIRVIVVREEVGGAGIYADEIVGNDSGGDNDSYIEGDTDTALFYVDAGNDRIGISTSTPSVLFDVAGASLFTGAFNVVGATGITGVTTIVGATGITGATTITGAAIVTTSVDIPGAAGLILENDETITNSADGVISIDGALDITAAGGLVLSNDETITNAVNGAVVVDGSFDITAAGGLILSNDETITNAVNGTIAADGIFQAPALALQDATEGSGLYKCFTATASSGTLIGATDKIEVDIPSGALLVAAQLRVDVAVTNAGDNTWAAAYSGGSTAEIAAAATAAAKNTKVNAFFDANGATAIASGETDITLTPQGADFTAGEISAVVYYCTLTSLADAP